MTARSELWLQFEKLPEDPEPAYAVAMKLCSEFVAGAWTTAKRSQFRISSISGGQTNLMFKCSLVDVAAAGSEPTTVLLRIQCYKDTMQLQNEVAMFIQLANAGLGPKLLGIFPGGRIEEYIPSRTLTYDTMLMPKYYQSIGELMARCHHVEVPLQRTSQLMTTMREWLERVKRNGGTEWEMWSNAAKVPEGRYPRKITVDDLSRELDSIEKFMNASNSPFYLSHNDLVYSNILLKDGYSIDDEGVHWKEVDGKLEKTDEDVLVLIDFEFGSYNYRAFDNGSHLNEYSMDWSALPLHKIDREAMENRIVHEKYCRSYAKQTYKILKSEDQLRAAGLTGDLEKDTAMLIEEATDFQPIGHFYWGLWNIICDQEGSTSMDFGNGFRDRFSLYFHMKKF